MITPQDVYKFINQNVADDIMNYQDTDELNADLVNDVIKDSYTELSPLNDYIKDNEVLDVYAKVLSATALLDRVGIRQVAFEGLRIREAKIRALIEKIILDKKISGKKSKVVGIVPRDASIIITDDFIDRYSK